MFAACGGFLNIWGRRVGPQPEVHDVLYSEAQIRDDRNTSLSMERDCMIEIQRKAKQMVDKEINESQDVVAKKIHVEMEHFFNSRSDAFLQKVFNENADATTGTILPDRLAQSLEALGIRLTEDQLEVAFRTADIDCSGGLCQEEFRRAVQSPLKLEEWAANLPLSALLGRCLSFKGGNDPLREAAGMSSEECRLVVEAFSEGVLQLVEEALGELRQCYEVRFEANMGRTYSKFKTFKLSGGNINDFHAGLAGRVGDPQEDLRKGMKEEHCEMAGCDVEFETSNYGVRTTPRKEYEIVTGTREGLDEQMKDRRGKVVRVVRKISELQELQMVRDARLVYQEIAALVLYTGPMFQVYNTILRRYPEQEYQLFKDGSNLFATTIHVLVSGVMKLSRSQSLASGLELYRGLGGLMELPEGFYRADERGCRGYMEWGFLSTTSDKAAALEYSGIKEGRPLATLLRMTTNSADRPACMYELSQYPGEREYLYVPCSYLEPLRGSRTLELVRIAHADEEKELGAVEVVAVRVNANLKGQTVEELEGRKKALHLAAFRYAVLEADREMARVAIERGLEERLMKDPSRDYDQKRWIEWGGRMENLLHEMWDGKTIKFTGEGLRAYLVREAQKVLTRHEALPNHAYVSNDAYRRLVDEMLRALQAPEAVLSLYLEDPASLIETRMKTGLMDGLRGYHSHLWRMVLEAGDGEVRAKAAGRVCVSVGLMEASPDEEDSEGLTPLMRAAADGAAPRALRCLVWAGADIDRRDVKDRSALLFAAEYGHAHVVEELGRLGADVNLVAYPGFEGTPAYFAAKEGHVEVIEALGRLGADVERPVLDGRTPLNRAASNGHTAAVRALHTLKADVNTPDKEGKTPIFTAAMNGHSAAVRVLHSLKANFNTPDKLGMTPICTAAMNGNLAAVRVLQSLRADVNTRDKEGMTPLFSAAMNGHLEVVRVLHSLKADVNSPNTKGLTPLGAAKDGQHRAVVEALQGMGGRGLSASNALAPLLAILPGVPQPLLPTAEARNLKPLMALPSKSGSKLGAHIQGCGP